MALRPDPITTHEVRGWFARLGAALPDSACQSVASRFQRIAESRGRARPERSFPGPAPITWDFNDVAKAANTVLASIPIMLSSCEQRLQTPEARADYEAVMVLGEALKAAMPYVECPWGDNKKDRRHPPKDWHLPAVLIANTITEALVQTGHERPSRSSGTTVFPQVIRDVLIRAGYRKVEAGTIAQHLNRWFAWAGEPYGVE